MKKSIFVLTINLSEDERACPCGGIFEPTEIPSRLFQQVEMIGRGIQIRQYKLIAWRCSQCHKIHYVKLPPSIQRCGLFRPQLQAVVIYMKSQGHLSIKNIRAFFLDIHHIPVFQEVFGHHFPGVMCCDFWSVYRKYLKSGTKDQFCWARSIRDIKFLTVLNDPLDVEYGCQLLQTARQIFNEIHHRDESEEQRVRWKLRQIQLEMLYKATVNVPDNTCCQNMANRFILFGDCYFRFIDDPTVFPIPNQ